MTACTSVVLITSLAPTLTGQIMRHEMYHWTYPFRVMYITSTYRFKTQMTEEKLKYSLIVAVARGLMSYGFFI